MTTNKRFGETVLGWFVVREGEERGDDQATTRQRAIAAPGKAPRVPAAPARPAPPLVALKGSEIPPVVAGATPDAGVFAQVYRAADISQGEQERVEKALNLVQSLPAETPREVKKQIVEASLRAFGIPVDAIIEAGAQEIQALHAYIAHGEKHTQDVLADAGARIAKLEAEIGEVRRLMDLQVNTQLGLARASNDEKLRVQAVLEFFGQEAVARVVQASPKLAAAK